MSFFAKYPISGGAGGVPIYASIGVFPAGTTIGDLGVAANTGNLYEWNGSIWQLIGGPGAALTLANLDSQSATAQGAALVSGALSMQSADATHPGLVNNTTQSFSGNKTFTGTISASNLSGTNTGDVTIGTANGLSLSSQALSLALSSTSTTGALSNTDWNTFNGKQASGNYITALTGDGTAAGPGSVALTLATVNSSPGSFGSASTSLSATVNGKGLITALSSQAIQIAESQVTNLITDLAAKVTAVSVATANGFAGSSGGTSTPALTLTTTVTGILKGNATAISAATAGTDYSAGTSALATGILKSTTTTGALSIATGADLPTIALTGDVTGSASGGSIATTYSGTLALNKGGTGQTTKAPAFDALQPMSALGDVIYGGASGTGTALSGNITSTKKFLTQTGTGSVSAAPGWNTIAAGDLPTIALTSDVTGSASGGSIATTIAANAVSNAKFRQSAGLSVVGNSTSSTANVADITGTANQTLVVNSGGTALAFGALNIASASAVTGTLAITNGGTAVTSVTTSPTATTFAGWDANKNLSANNALEGFTSTATAAGTTTLTVSSTYTQVFTGSTTQTVTLPVATTLVNGQSFSITNLSSGVVTVQTSGSNSIQAMAANTTILVTCINTAGGTGTASWDWAYGMAQSAVLPIAQGGTNNASLGVTNGGVIYADGSKLATTAAGSSGQVLQSAGAGAPTWVTNSLAYAITSQSTTYSAAIGDYILANSGSAFTITLPTAVGNSGKSIIIKKTSNDFNVITVSTTSSQTVDGVVGTTVNTQYECLEVTSDGSNWNVTERKIPAVWTSYTPTFTGFGTASAVSCWWLRQGQDILLRCKFTAGTSTNVEARVSLPGTLTSDATAVASIQVAGQLLSNGNLAGSFNMLIESNVAYVTMGYSTSTTAGLTKQTGSGTIATGGIASFNARIPITGWNG